MAHIPGRFVDIVQQLKENKQPRRSTVRNMLKWFNAARRGANVVAEIEEALTIVGLKTEPPFAQASLDDPLQFLLKFSPNGPMPSTLPAADQAEPPLTESAPENEGAQPLMDGNGAPPATSPDFLEPDDETPLPAKADDRPVTSQPNDWNLSTLRNKLDRGLLELQPAYQREYVWKLPRATFLIN